MPLSLDQQAMPAGLAQDDEHSDDAESDADHREPIRGQVAAPARLAHPERDGMATLGMKLDGGQCGVDQVIARRLYCIHELFLSSIEIPGVQMPHGGFYDVIEAPGRCLNFMP